MAVRRGDIAVVDFAAAGQPGLEKRPVVIVTNDVANRFSGALTVVLITDWDEKKARLPVCVELPRGVAGATKRSIIHCGQVHTMKRELMRETKSAVPIEVLDQIDAALRIHLGLALR